MVATRHLTKLPGFRWMWRRMPVGSVHTRTEYDIWQKPPYAFGVYWAASLARSLGLREVTAIEFGVAGGDGLVSLENHAKLIGASFGIKIAVYGFDSGQGMPEPQDYRDLPYVWSAGYYAVEPDKVRERLSSANLMVGAVAATVDEFLKSDIPPIGFIGFELDFHSSTSEAFKIFDGPESTRLPRVFCYFDDIIWPVRACFNEHTGEYLAINEFNEKNEGKKISKWSLLSWTRPHPAAWNEEMYVFHDFHHQHYNTSVEPREVANRP